MVCSPLHRLSAKVNEKPDVKLLVNICDHIYLADNLSALLRMIQGGAVLERCGLGFCGVEVIVSYSLLSCCMRH